MKVKLGLGRLKQSGQGYPHVTGGPITSKIDAVARLTADRQAEKTQWPQRPTQHASSYAADWHRTSQVVNSSALSVGIVAYFRLSAISVAGPMARDNLSRRLSSSSFKIALKTHLFKYHDTQRITGPCVMRNINLLLLLLQVGRQSNSASSLIIRWMNEMNEWINKKII